MSQLEVDKIIPQSGTTLTLGDTGDTINFGSGVLPNFENLTVTGDLTVDTNSLKVDSTNNRVGIGTATPAVALDVVGAITATGNITGTLATASQPNITSVGTLTSATVSGDLTVDTNTLFVDSTDNRVGIGTSSPTVLLDVAGNLNAGNTINFGLADANNTIVNVGTGATGNKFAITDYIGDTTYTDYGLRVGRKNDGANGTSALEHRGTGQLVLNAIDAGNIQFLTSNTERMRIDSSGNVGIGTSTINSKLSVYDSSQSDDFTLGIFTSEAAGTGETQSLIKILKSGTGTEYGGAIGGYLSQGVGSGLTLNTLNGGTLTEIMRLQNNGNVGIGTTSPSVTFDAEANGATVAHFNRTTDDGNIIELQKDGTTVGSIGSRGGASTFFEMTSSGKGVSGSDAGSGAILPYSSGNISDNVLDLGASSYRWNDLYLGGSVYLGGTTSANALDDYEEGTWTPSLSGYTMGTSNEGWYLKVGRLCLIVAEIQWSSGSGNPSYINGLPFSGSTSSNGDYAANSIPMFEINGITPNSSNDVIYGRVNTQSNTTDIQLLQVDYSAGSHTGTPPSFSSSGRIRLSFSYSVT